MRKAAMEVRGEERARQR